MYLIVVAWLYVALMMAAAEATHAQGSIVGAFLTFVLYGVAPVSLVIYLLGFGRRKRARLRREQEAEAPAETVASGQPDGSGEAAADAVAPVREKP